MCIHMTYLLIFISSLCIYIGKILLGKEVVNRKNLQGIGLLSKLAHNFTNKFFIRESFFRSKKKKIVITEDMSVREKRIAVENKKKETLLLFFYRGIAVLNIGLYFYDDDRGGLSYRLLEHKAINT
jgi:hypothetical protein